MTIYYKTANHYNGFYVLKQNDGSDLAVADNSGKVAGSHAVYVKEVSSNKDTTKVYKTTYDNEVDISTLHSLKLNQSFINENDKNIEHYMDLAIKDFKN